MARTLGSFAAADKKSHAELNAMRAKHAECFDCDAKKPGWAVLPHGVFVCIDCAQVHRNLGTHISKVPAHRVPGAVAGEEASDLLFPQS